MQLRHCPRNDWCPSLQTWLRATTVAGAKLAMERCSVECLVPLHSTRKLRSLTWLMAQRDKQKKGSVNDAGLVCPHRSGAGSDDRLLSSSWALGDCRPWGGILWSPCRSGRSRTLALQTCGEGLS